MSYFEYDSNIKLAAWKGFRIANPFEKIISSKESSGLVNLYINNISADCIHNISIKEHNAIEYIQTNDVKIRDVILSYLFNKKFINTSNIDIIKEKLAIFSLNIIDKKKKKDAQVKLKLYLCCDEKMELTVLMYKHKIKKVKTNLMANT